MDKIVDARFDRVEKALANLIASISKYNPNPTLAQDLVLADEELNDGLSLLNQHQQNTHTLNTLHTTSAALDLQISEVLELLSGTRSELLKTQSSEYPENTNSVDFEELLRYAARISKWTIPPEVQKSKQEDSSPKQDGNATNGSTTPSVIVTGNGADIEVPSATPNGANLSVPSQSQSTQSQFALDDRTKLMFGLPDPARPLFLPWPSEDDLKNGALATIQALVEGGIDPERWDPQVEEQKKMEKAKELEREAEAEAERIKEEERKRLEMEKRNNTSCGGAGAEKPKVFQLDEFDDDDE